MPSTCLCTCVFSKLEAVVELRASCGQTREVLYLPLHPTSSAKTVRELAECREQVTPTRVACRLVRLAMNPESIRYLTPVERQEVEGRRLAKLCKPLPRVVAVEDGKRQWDDYAALNKASTGNIGCTRTLETGSYVCLPAPFFAELQKLRVDGYKSQLSLQIFWLLD